MGAVMGAVLIRFKRTFYTKTDKIKICKSLIISKGSKFLINQNKKVQKLVPRHLKALQQCKAFFGLKITTSEAKIINSSIFNYVLIRHVITFMSKQNYILDFFDSI
jgi:hypothetical protein